MKRPSWRKILAALLAKRKAGQITPQQYAERKTRIVTARIVFRESKS